MPNFQKRGGKWSVRFRWIDPATGSEIQKRLGGFATKSEAERAKVLWEMENPSGKFIANAGTTFEQMANTFLAWQKERIKSTTFYEMERVFLKYFLPQFGKKIVSKITKNDILEWQNNLNSAGFSYAYKNKLRGFLFSFFRYAEKYHDCKNIVSEVDAFVAPKIKKDMRIWSLQQFEQFLQVTAEPYTTFFMFLYYLGLRLGECLALTWADIDMNTNMVTVSKSVTEKVANKAWAVVEPKNLSSYRKIEMPNILTKHLTRLTKTTLGAPFLFFGARPLPQTSLRRIFKAYTLKSDLPPIRLHDFRHSHASLLISLGANVVLIAKRLGHTNIEMTLNTYSHLMPSAENEIITKLDKLKNGHKFGHKKQINTHKTW